MRITQVSEVCQFPNLSRQWKVAELLRRALDSNWNYAKSCCRRLDTYSRHRASYQAVDSLSL